MKSWLTRAATSAEDRLVEAATFLVLIPMWGAIFLAIAIGRTRKFVRWLARW